VDPLLLCLSLPLPLTWALPAYASRYLITSTLCHRALLLLLLLLLLLQPWLGLL